LSRQPVRAVAVDNTVGGAQVRTAGADDIRGCIAGIIGMNTRPTAAPCTTPITRPTSQLADPTARNNAA
jgi:hypothetical protein